MASKYKPLLFALINLLASSQARELEPNHEHAVNIKSLSTPVVLSGQQVSLDSNLPTEVLAVIGTLASSTKTTINSTTKNHTLLKTRASTNTINNLVSSNNSLVNTTATTITSIVNSNSTSSQATQSVCKSVTNTTNSATANSTNNSMINNITNSNINSRDAGNMSITAPVHLSAEQKAYFSQPLSLSKTPNTDIPYQDDGQSFTEFKQFLIEQARKQGFSASILQAIQNIQLNKSVIKLDISQYERIQVKPAVTKTTTDTSNTTNSTVTPNSNNNFTSNSTNNTSNTTNNSKPTKPQVITPPKSQFVPSTLMQKYLSLHITQGKVERALSLLDNYRFMLDQISEIYHVPVQVIIGLWGMETSFGRSQGNYKLLDALASLAYEGRRRQFFIKEFFNALRIIELNQFDPNNVLSSWAGAIGQIQFLPSSFLNYAVDGNGDGIINIWYSTIDSFASIANYLHKNNWDDQIPWGIEVNLTVEQYLNFQHKGTLGLDSSNAHTLNQWQDLGINLDLDQDSIIGLNTMPSSTKFWLVVPDNEPSYAYLVTKNYKAYLRWNRSKYFAFANGIFADRIYESEQMRDKQDQQNNANTRN